MCPPSNKVLFIFLYFLLQSFILPATNFLVFPCTKDVGYCIVLLFFWSWISSCDYQNGSSSSWNMPGSRMMPSAQELAYYNLLGQNQQYAGFRQGQQQQPSQYDGAFGYSNLYRSQPGVARDHQHQQQNFDHQHQQQNFGGSTAGDSPDLLSHQLHQLWRQH